jgi:hypothetical protein
MKKIKYLLILAMMFLSCGKKKDNAYEFLQNVILSNRPEAYIDTESPTYFKASVVISLLQQADSSKLISKTTIGSSVKVYVFEAYRSGSCDTFMIFVRKAKNGYVISNALIKGVSK